MIHSSACSRLSHTSLLCHSLLFVVRRRFDLHFTEPSVLPAEYKTTVFKIVLCNGGQNEYDRVKATYYATEDNIERKYATYHDITHIPPSERLLTPLPYFYTHYNSLVDTP